MPRNLDNLLTDIENEIEYLLFVDHEEDMKGYTHLRPLIQEVAKLVVRHIDKAVVENERDMKYLINRNLTNTLSEHVADIFHDAPLADPVFYAHTPAKDHNAW